MKERLKKVLIIVCMLISSIFWNFNNIKADTFEDEGYGFTTSDQVTTNETVSETENVEKEEGSDKLMIVLIVVASIVALEVIFIIIYFINMKIKRAKNKKMTLEERLENKKIEANNKIMNELPDFDFDHFNDEVYKIYIDIKEARVSFNYDELRKLLTDELYNTYYMELSELEKEKNKINTSDYTLNDLFITNFIKTEKDYIIDVYMKVNLYEYVVNNMGNVINGTRDNMVEKKYIVRLTRRIDDNKDICPNCGSQLLNDVSNICPFCNNIIINKKYEWVVMKMDEVK